MISYAEKIILLVNCENELGEATARYLIDSGGSVVILKHRDNHSYKFSEELVSQTTVIAGDHAAIEAKIAKLPRVDTLITFPTPTACEQSSGNTPANYIQDTLTAMNIVLQSMERNGHGRIVNVVSSSAIFGSRWHPHWSAAYASMISYTQSFSQAVRETDIHLNALTSFTKDILDLIVDDSCLLDLSSLESRYVLPAIAYLGHQASSLNGEVLSAGGGRFSRYVTSVSPGFFDQCASPDDLDINLDQVMRQDHPVFPTTPADELLLISV